MKVTNGDIGKLIGYSVLVFGNFFAFFFTQRYVEETKDKSIEECVALYQYPSVEERKARKKRRKSNNALLDHKNIENI